MPLIDGDFEDEDGPNNGTYKVTVRDFAPFDAKYILRVFDNLPSEAVVTLEYFYAKSNYSVSGKITSPPNTKNLMVFAEWFRDSLGTQINFNVISLNDLKNKEPLLNTLLNKNNFLKKNTNPELQDHDKFGYFFATLTTSDSGKYYIGIPDSLGILKLTWNVGSFDFLGVAPGLLPPFPKRIIIDRHVTGINFAYQLPVATVEGKVLDQATNLPLKTPSGDVLTAEVFAIDDFGKFVSFTRTDINGMYKLPLPFKGHFRIIVGEEIVPLYIIPLPFEVFVNEGDKLVHDFFAYKSNSTIKGRVFFKNNNKGAGGVEVVGGNFRIGFTRTRTDTSGNYVLSVSNLGEWDLRLEFLPPFIIVEGGNMRHAKAGDINVNFPLVPPDPRPMIMAVRDIPNDQGLKVRVIWNGSDLDSRDRREIEQYSLWRQVPPGAPSEKPVKGIDKITSLEEGNQYIINGAPWDFIAEIPAIGEPVYAYVSPTLADSTEKGDYESVFIVIAHHEWDKYRLFYSDPKGGSSVDNLKPAFLGASAEALTGSILVKWSVDIGTHFDIVGYNVYRSTTAGFTPGPANRIGKTFDFQYEDKTAQKGTTYYYRIEAVDDAGNTGVSDEVSANIGGPSAITNRTKAIPKEFGIDQNYPNPFNPETVINYQLPKDGYVTITIFNVLGQKIRTLINGKMSAGYKSVKWDGKSDSEINVPNGLYIYEIKVKDNTNGKVLFRKVMKMTMLK
jgi:hypothetical protein